MNRATQTPRATGSSGANLISQSRATTTVPARTKPSPP